MIDRTNIGIRHLRNEETQNNPNIASSYISQPGTTTILPDTDFQTYFTPQTTLPEQVFTSITPDANASYIPSPDAQTLSVFPEYGAQSIITSTPVTFGAIGSILPTVTSPELVSPSPLAQTVGTYATTNLGGTSVLVPLPAPQNPPSGLITDEDFQRKRPIYNEVSDKEYLNLVKSFKLF